LVKPGRRRRDLTEERVWIISRLFEGPKRWTQLWDQSKFQSRRHLSTCLDELEGNGSIVRRELSHKNVIYILADDFGLLQKLHDANEKIVAGLPGVLKEIQESKWDRLHATSFVSVILLQELGNFVKAVGHTVRVPEKFQEYAEVWLDSFTTRFSQLLAVCDQTYPDSTDSAINFAKFVIFWAMCEISRPPSLPAFVDFDLPQVRREYEGMINTLREESQNLGRKT